MPSIASCVLMPPWLPPLLSSCLPRWHLLIPPPGFSVQLSLHPLGEDTVSAALVPSSSFSSLWGAGWVPLTSTLLCPFTTALDLRWGVNGGMWGDKFSLGQQGLTGDGWGRKNMAEPKACLEQELRDTISLGHRHKVSQCPLVLFSPQPTLLQDPLQQGVFGGLAFPDASLSHGSVPQAGSTTKRATCGRGGRTPPWKPSRTGRRA